MIIYVKMMLVLKCLEYEQTMLGEVSPTVFDDVTVEFGPLGRGHWMLRDQLDDLSIWRMAGDTAIITGWSSPHLYRVSICFDMIYIYIIIYIYSYISIWVHTFSIIQYVSMFQYYVLLYNV